MPKHEMLPNRDVIDYRVSYKKIVTKVIVADSVVLSSPWGDNDKAVEDHIANDPRIFSAKVTSTTIELVDFKIIDKGSVGALGHNVGSKLNKRKGDNRE